MITVCGFNFIWTILKGQVKMFLTAKLSQTANLLRVCIRILGCNKTLYSVVLLPQGRKPQSRLSLGQKVREFQNFIFYYHKKGIFKNNKKKVFYKEKIVVLQGFYNLSLSYNLSEKNFVNRALLQVENLVNKETLEFILI